MVSKKKASRKVFNNIKQARKWLWMLPKTNLKVQRLAHLLAEAREIANELKRLNY